LTYKQTNKKIKKTIKNQNMNITIIGVREEKEKRRRGEEGGEGKGRGKGGEEGRERGRGKEEKIKKEKRKHKHTDNFCVPSSVTSPSFHLLPSPVIRSSFPSDDTHTFCNKINYFLYHFIPFLL
jgi:hypothetical protein